MNTLKTNLLIFIFCCFGSILCFSDTQPAQKNQQGSVSPKVGSKKVDLPAFRDAVESKISDITTLVEGGKVKGIELLSNAAICKSWADNQYIEPATKVRREWYTKLGKCLEEMSKCKTTMETAEERNLNDSYEKAKAAYTPLQKKFKEIVKNPDKIKSK